ncbi:MAG: LURP-one-related family protein [Aerococcaceae bacterium]|nr:LURP-one-related family protein [Aerococcaceae bacterium]
MQFYIKERVWSFTDSFDIYDAYEQPLYTVRGKVFSLRKTRTLMDYATQQEVTTITQKLWSFLPTYEITSDNDSTVTLRQQLTFFKPVYSIPELDWEIRGNFLERAYTIYDAKGNDIARISKRWMTWSDTYEVDIVDKNADEKLVISIVLAIDAGNESR